MVDLGSLIGREAVDGATGPVTGPRPLRPRRSLPGARALTGGLLVAAAAVGLFAAYARTQAGPTHSFVVTRHGLAAGTVVSPSDVVLQPMDLPAGLAARAFAHLPDVLGTTVLSPLGPGELVQPSALVATRGPRGARSLSFPVERSRLGPLKQGERVDVVATYGTGVDAWSTVVLRQATVAGVDRPKSTLGDGGSVVLTIAVEDPSEELALAHAVALGKVTVVVATGAAAAAGPPPTYRSGAPSR